MGGEFWITCGFCGRGQKECDSIYGCASHLSAEVERLRDRERRVVRVFWRVRDASGNGDECEYELLSQARDCVPDGGKVYRVTVRRVAKVRT